MRRLPALVDGDRAWVLPFSDRSAVALVEDFLKSPGSARSIGCLVLDPPFLLWVACRAFLTGHEFTSVGRLLEWLRDRGPALLQWQDDEAQTYSASYSETECDRFVKQVEADLVVAEVAAALAEDDGPEVVETARLLGTLSGAATWLPLVSPEVEPTRILPRLLQALDATPAGHRVAEAQRIAQDAQAAASSSLDVQALQEWAAGQVQGWQRAIRGLPELLPSLMARLGRLDALERRFQETLEEEKLESLAEFAAGAGHEINNPLAIIGGRSQLLLRDEESPERQRDLALIVAQVRRANEMIADMRLFSRPPEPECESFDLSELVDQAVSEFAAQAVSRGIEVTRAGDTAALAIEADPVQITVVLHALCRNAIEAIGRDGAVEVSVRRTPTGAEISVVDNGPGILPEERRHLFDPFYSARQAGRGLGFGLSKAWRIVTNHGGRIEVESEPGEGALFVVHLPRRARREKSRLD